MNKIALISANFGGIDEMKWLPDHPGIDALYYTDKKNIASQFVKASWNKIIIPPYPRHDFNARMKYHYFKQQLHRLAEIKEGRYEWFVWMDASLQLKDLSFIYNHIERYKSPLCVPHPERQCVLDEYTYIMREIFDNKNGYLIMRYGKEKLTDQLAELTDLGNPSTQDLLCGGAWLLPNTNAAEGFLNDWWDQSLRYGTADQLAFSYMLEKNGLTPTKLNVSVFKNQYWDYIPHVRMM